MKLIRDKYKSIIESDRLQYAAENDLTLKKKLLKDKLLEEVQELIDSDFKDIKEYGDVLEVLHALAKFNNFLPIDVEMARRDKENNFGAFNTFLLLKD